MSDGKEALILQALEDLKVGQRDTNTGIRDLTAKVERNITATEVLKVQQAEVRKDLDEHVADHAESKKWMLGLVATAIVGAFGTLWAAIKSGFGMK